MEVVLVVSILGMREYLSHEVIRGVTEIMSVSENVEFSRLDRVRA